MEPQDTIYCYEKKEDKKSCLGIIAIILLASFAVVIGLILGAAISAAVLAALPAVIVLAVVLGLLLILTIIFMICNRKNIKNAKEVVKIRDS